MTLVPYAITSSAPAPGILRSGIGGVAVSWVALDDLGVWVSEDKSAEQSPGSPASTPFGSSAASAFAEQSSSSGAAVLLRHHVVIEAACAAGPCLPVRFGATFPDRPALLAALARRAPALRAALAHVGTRREVSVTLEWLDPVSEAVSAGTPSVRTAVGDVAERSAESRPEPAIGAGRRFMEARRAHWRATDIRRARAAQLERELLANLGARVREFRTRVCPSSRVALSCAVLVDRGDAEPVARVARAATTGWPDVRGHVGGPWPPYSFVDVPDEAAAQHTGQAES